MHEAAASSPCAQMHGGWEMPRLSPPPRLGGREGREEGEVRRGGLLRPCRRQRQWEGALLTSDTGARALGS